MTAGERSRFLLDTHTFLWMAFDPERLGSAARERIESVASVLLLSLGRVWEMAIKASLGKLATQKLTGGRLLRCQQFARYMLR